MTAGGSRLAIYNFGLHAGPEGDPRVEGFVLREPANFEAAARASGFLGRSGYRGVPGPRSWGQQVFPRFIEGSGFDSAPSSLSLWTDIESLMAFSYHGVHADALKHGRNWNIKPSWPPLVLWWVDGHRVPDWQDGAGRLDISTITARPAEPSPSNNPSPPGVKPMRSTGTKSGGLRRRMPRGRPICLRMC